MTDPELLLKDGRYLRRPVLDHCDDRDDEDDEDIHGDRVDRWQLLVLEDAEALLRKGHRLAAAMSMLLNLTDGLLGQGLRCLFLITTNEPLAAVHPALVPAGGACPTSSSARCRQRRRPPCWAGRCPGP